MDPAFKKYSAQVVANARALAAGLLRHGFALVTGGTDNHLMLVDLTNKNISGRAAAVALNAAGIVLNCNAVPFDTRKPFDPSGIRLGTAAVTSRGFCEAEMEKIADWINDVITAPDAAYVRARVSSEIAALLPALGVHDLGESRPQELWRKAAVVPPPIRWHLIGHLQRNKVERTLLVVDCIHSVDSVRLLHALEVIEAADDRKKPLPVLLEVNASREASKHGFAPEEIPGLAARLVQLRHVRVEGLMTMAAYEEDPQRTRPTFAALRGLRDRLAADLGRPLPHLSMGMSNDFEIAIEEGATLVRLGTVLFEGIAP